MPALFSEAGISYMFKQKGFTLIELVIIMVLIGIMAVFAAPRLYITSTNAAAFSDKLRADIRYAQNLAMTQARRWRVYVNTPPAPNPGYAVVNDANGNGTWGEPGEFAADPAGGAVLSITLDAGQFAGITVSTPALGYIEFNSLGAPTTGGTTLIISPGGLAVEITAQTGALN